jgi:hypothetical protein
MTGVLWLDHGIRCGTIFVGHGDEFPEEPATFRTSDTPQLDRPDQIGTALRALAGETRRELWLLAGAPLPRWRVPFGKPFKSDGGGERFRAPTRGVMQEPSRGPGTLAHFTEIAVSTWGPRAPREMDALGKRLQRCDDAGRDARGSAATTAGERWLARQIEAKADARALVRLDALIAELPNVDRRCVAVQRAGRAA